MLGRRTQDPGHSRLGDVKAGAVAGLVGRGASPEQAAMWGLWLHGKAGERAGAGAARFVARHVVEAIPRELVRAEDGAVASS